jgi:SAM-dependent methyltransferase
VIPEDERLDLLLLSKAVRYQRWVIASFGSAVRGRVLEVGAGVGNFTRWLAQTADHVVVAEPDASMADDLTAAAPDNVEVRAVPIEELGGSRERFDSVVAINVLEHIEDDLSAVQVAHEVLRPGGRLCVFVPAHRVLFGSLDRRYGHLRRYTKGGTMALLQAADFHVSICRYFNPVGALGWWAVGRLARRGRLSRGSVWLSERVAVPVGRALERVTDPPFGQSVLAVGVRPMLGHPVRM